MGARIVSLLGPDGSEWLVQPSGDLVDRPEGSSSYAAVPPYGWDELIPTIEACDHCGRSLPDHGEAWAAKWHVDHEGALTFTEPGGRYALRRQVLAVSRAMRLNYRLVASEQVDVLWAPHPLLRCPPGTTLRLPPIRSMLRVDHLPTESVMLKRIVILADELARGECRKYYAMPPDRVAWMELLRRDGRTLRLDWSVEALPYFGIYGENHCYTAEACVAPEPSTAWYDDLSFAVGNDTVLRVRPGEAHEWSIRITMI